MVIVSSTILIEFAQDSIAWPVTLNDAEDAACKTP
jgi:hypothetical protein